MKRKLEEKMSKVNEKPKDESIEPSVRSSDRRSPIALRVTNLRFDHPTVDCETQRNLKDEPALAPELNRFTRYHERLRKSRDH